MTMKEIMEAAASLSVEERAMVVDSILRSLSPPDPDTDSKWAAVAQRRLGERRSGAVEANAGDEVFEKVWKRYEE